MPRPCPALKMFLRVAFSDICCFQTSAKSAANVEQAFINTAEKIHEKIQVGPVHSGRRLIHPLPRHPLTCLSPPPPPI